MKKTWILLFCLFGAVMGLMPGGAQAALLSHESFTTASGAGIGGGGSVDPALVQAAQLTNAMVMASGESWAGGAAGVQGGSSLNCYGWSYSAANATFGWLVGSRVDELNATYGAGNWTITNVTLTFQYTLYANNLRFNAGAGTFDTYWVGNDNWQQSVSDPVYAANAADLLAWSGSQALLASTNYTWTTPGYTGTYSDLGTVAWQTDKDGIKQSTLTIDLALTSELLNDIIAASAASNDKVSLYLMATSDMLGLTIFTGGSDAAGGILPTLSFDVVTAPVPIPPSMFLLASGLGGFAVLRRRTAGRYFRNLLRLAK